MTQTQTNLVNCPLCKARGKRVGSATVSALLKPEFAATIGDQGRSDGHPSGCKPVSEDSQWRFCESDTCEVVYYSATNSTMFTKPQLQVAVGTKETSGDRPLCYCFGHSVESIKSEIEATGRSTATEKIRQQMKDPGCRCEIENPSGTCCLGSVNKGIAIAESELEPNVTQLPTRKRNERIAKAGSVFAAVMASSCCWLPLLLLSVGVSGAGIAATLETFRPMFIVVTVAFLGAAFYFTYRPQKLATTTTAADCCATDTTTGETCCDPGPSRWRHAMAINKLMLWFVTAVAVAFLFFPSYVGAFINTDDRMPVSGDLVHGIVQIEGMTCEGCSVVVEEAIRGTPGVVAVSVDYEKATVTIGAEACCPFPEDAILAAVKDAGYMALPID